MRKIYITCLVIAVLTFAACENRNEPKNVTVSEARNQRDGTLVKLTGSIEKTAVPEMYTFSDGTGSIAAEIDSEVWTRSGINLGILSFPVRVEIEGEVDKERNSEAYIDVSRVRVL